MELKSDRKTAGIPILMGLFYTIIAGIVILIFATQVPQLASASMNFLIMLFSAGFAIVFIGLVQYRHEFPEEDKFYPAFITGVILVITIQFTVPLVGGQLFNSAFGVALPMGILGFFIVTQAPLVEEFVFCGLFQTGAVAMVRRIAPVQYRIFYNVVLLGILASVFTLYHGYVYGSDMVTLSVVFIARIIYALSYAYTDNLDLPFMLHFINNAAAGLPFLLGGFI